MDITVLRNIILFLLISGFFVFVGLGIQKPADTVIYYKGKGYKLYSLVGEGYTRENRVPVYSAVFIPVEQAK